MSRPLVLLLALYSGVVVNAASDSTNAAAAFEQKARAALADWAQHETSIFAQIANLDPKAVPEAYRRLERVAHSSSTTAGMMRKRLVQRWAETDARAALAQVSRAPDDFEKWQLIEEIAKVWARRDLEAAAAWARELPSGHRWDDIVRIIVAAQVAHDPVAAVRWAEASKPLVPRPSIGHQDRIWVYTFEEWARRDARAAAEFARSLPESQRRLAAILTCATQWLQRDASAAFAWVRALPEWEEYNLHGNFFARYLKRDLSSAAEAALQMTPAVQETVAPLTAAEIAGKDVSAALAWAQKVPHAKARELAMAAVGERLLNSKNAQAAADLALTMPAGTPRDDLTRWVAANLARTDPQAGVNWVRMLPAGKGRDNASDALVEIWSESDVFAAAEFLLTIPTEEWLGRPDYKIAQRLAKRDPEAAVRWAQRLPADRDAPAVIGTIFSEWAERNPEAAAAWARTISDPDARALYLDRIADRTAEKKRRLNGERREHARFGLAIGSPARSLQKRAERALAMKPGDEQAVLAREVVTELARKDWHQAIAWWQRLPAGGVAQHESLLALVTERSWTDPRGATEFVLAQEKADPARDTLERVASQWAESDPTQAMRWVEQQPEPIRERLLEPVLHAWATRFPRSASEYFS